MTKMEEQTLDVNLSARASVDPAKTTLQVPKICSFKGSRGLVMTKVWEDARALETKGIPLDNQAFGYLIRRNWAVIKEEQRKSCPISSPQQIEQALSKV